MEFSSSHALSLKPAPPGSATGPEEKTFGAMPHMIATPHDHNPCLFARGKPCADGGCFDGALRHSKGLRLFGSTAGNVSRFLVIGGGLRHKVALINPELLSVSVPPHLCRARHSSGCKMLH